MAGAQDAEGEDRRLEKETTLRLTEAPAEPREGVAEATTALELRVAGTGAIRQRRASPALAYSFVQVGTRPGVQGAPAVSIAPSRARRSVSTSVRSVASCFSNASEAMA